MYFLETLKVCAPCHGVVLYSFLYWWNVVWIFYELFRYWEKKLLSPFSPRSMNSYMYMFVSTSWHRCLYIFLCYQIYMLWCRLFFVIFHVLFTFYAISNICKKNGEKIFGGGGGGAGSKLLLYNFFFSIFYVFFTFYAISILISFRVLCYFQHYFLNIEKCPFTYWLNGRWFLQIVDRDSGNLYPIYPLLLV